MPRKKPEKVLVLREVTAADTGEQIDAYVEEDAPKQRPKRSVEERWRVGDGHFTIVYHDHLHRLAGLTALGHDVMAWMFAHMKHDEPFTFVAREVAEDTSSSRVGVANILGDLRRRQLLIPLGGRRYVVDPRLAWRGERPARKEMLDWLRQEGLIDDDIHWRQPWTTPKTTTGSTHEANQDRPA